MRREDAPHPLLGNIIFTLAYRKKIIYHKSVFHMNKQKELNSNGYINTETIQLKTNNKIKHTVALCPFTFPVPCEIDIPMHVLLVGKKKHFTNHNCRNTFRHFVSCR